MKSKLITAAATVVISIIMSLSAAHYAKADQQGIYRYGIVTEISGDTITYCDVTGNLYDFYGDDYQVGQTINLNTWEEATETNKAEQRLAELLIVHKIN